MPVYSRTVMRESVLDHDCVCVCPSPPCQASFSVFVIFLAYVLHSQYEPFLARRAMNDDFVNVQRQLKVRRRWLLCLCVCGGAEFDLACSSAWSAFAHTSHVCDHLAKNVPV